jgi:hypothetical protein
MKRVAGQAIASADSSTWAETLIINETNAIYARENTDQ